MSFGTFWAMQYDTRGWYYYVCNVYLAVSTAVTSASPAQQLWIVGPCGEDWVGSESEQDQTFKTQQTFK